VFVGSALGDAASSNAPEPGKRPRPRGAGGEERGAGEGAAVAGAGDPAVAGLKAWAVGKLPEGPTLYPKDMVGGPPGCGGWGGAGGLMGPRNRRMAVLFGTPRSPGGGRAPCRSLPPPPGTIPPQTPRPCQVSEQPERFFVSEIIREKIFLQYDQEIPYATQVGVWGWVWVGQAGGAGGGADRRVPGTSTTGTPRKARGAVAI
jgi:hypothetical protein